MQDLEPGNRTLVFLYIKICLKLSVDLTASRVNWNNTGSLEHADLHHAGTHLYTEPEVPLLYLYWPEKAFNH